MAASRPQVLGSARKQGECWLLAEPPAPATAELGQLSPTSMYFCVPGKSLLPLRWPKSDSLQLSTMIVQGQAWWGHKGMHQEKYLLQDKLVLRWCRAIIQTNLQPRAKTSLENLLQNCMKENLISRWSPKQGGHRGAELHQVLMLSKDHKKRFYFFLQVRPST